MKTVEMPKMGDTMEEGKILRWIKHEGDAVKKGESLAEVETDKVNIEIEAFASGVLRKILVPEGDSAPIGSGIALIGAADEPLPDGLASSTGEVANGKTAAPLFANTPATAPTPPSRQPSPAAPNATTVVKDAPAAYDADAQERIFISPVARRLAEERSIDYTRIRGTGPNGRIIKLDVEAALAQPAPIAIDTGVHVGTRFIASASTPTAPTTSTPTAPTTSTPTAPTTSTPTAPTASASTPTAPTPAPAPTAPTTPTAPTASASMPTAPTASASAPAPTASAPTASAPTTSTPAIDSGDVLEIPLTAMRRTIARRLSQSMQTAPHFYVTSVIDTGKLAELRKQINAYAASDPSPVKVSFNDLIIKAVARSLVKMPQVNISFAEDRLLQKKSVHIGMAVALEQGLIVPVIHNADRISILDIARESQRLAEAARTGKLRPEEFSGGTFTVSNLGMFDVESFTAVINPPESAILAIGSITPTPVVADGQVVVRDRMKVTLSSDHRAIDGATAARFLQEVKRLLEEPFGLLL